MKQTKQILLVLLSAFLSALAAGAQVTTSTSGPVPLDGMAGNTSDPPEFTLPDVTVEKKLTLNGADGTVTQECTFKNGGGGTHDFLFCNMIALESGDTSMSTNTCNITWDAATMEWSCVLGNNSKSANPPSYHFGCVVVHLGPNGSFTAPAASGGNIDFAGEEADDLQINYADIFDLSGGATFNSQSCEDLGCFGVNTDTNIEGTVQRPNGTGFWIIQDYPLTATCAVWQDLDGARYAKEYVTSEPTLAVPSTFPATVAQLGRTSPFDEPPTTFTVDLNMWDMFTMSEEIGVVTPVEFVPYVSGAVEGITVEVDPPEASLAGRSMDFGTVTLHIDPEARDLPEGTVMELSISAYDPRNGREHALWEQNGRFIQDTEPPVVEANSEQLFGGNHLEVSITASDVTTRPTGANFWYSVDDGGSWTPVPMASTSGDPFDESRTVTFTAEVMLDYDERKSADLNGGELQYFYNVQDSVHNNVWFGVGTMTVSKMAVFSRPGDP